MKGELIWQCYIRESKVQAKNITRDKERCYVIIRVNSPRWPNNFNAYAPNKGAAKYIKEKLPVLSRKIDKPVIIIEDFNMNLLVTDTIST